MDIVDLDVEGVGIGSLEGRAFAISGVIPGEQVEIRVQEESRGQQRAELIRVLRPSTRRVTARCRHAGVCGGCSWQHIAYAEQLKLKREGLQRRLAASLGQATPRVDPTIGMHEPSRGSKAPQVGTTIGMHELDDDGAPVSGHDPSAPWNFRHKVSFVFGPGPRGRSLVMGHYGRGSNAIVPAEECPVHAEAGNTLAFTVRDALVAAGVPGASADGQRGVARHLVVRVAHNRRELMATLVVTANDRALRGAVRRIVNGAGAPDGLHLNIHERPGPFLFGRTTRKLHGCDRLREEVASVTFLVSPTAFFQTNVRAAEILVELVVGAISDRPSRRVLDLYAGAGLFALPLARRGHQVTAVEENAEAVSDGLASQQFSQIPGNACRFVRGRVEEVLREGARGGLRGSRPDVVVLDPPRAGCPQQVLRALAGELRPPRIIYVSCNPDTLARDLAVAVRAGYLIERVQPVDMFPHTAHIESVALLTRCQSEPAP